MTPKDLASFENYAENSDMWKETEIINVAIHQNLKKVIKIFMNEIGDLRSTYLHSYGIRNET
jgi:hypothetical protein